MPTLTLDNTKTISDLVENSANEFGDRIFLTFEDDSEQVRDVTYEEFRALAQAVGSWVQDRSRQLGHTAKVALLGSSSVEYLSTLLGAMASGNVGIPLDTQLDVARLADSLNRSDVDVLFYDWEHDPLVEAVREQCPEVSAFVPLQHGSSDFDWHDVIATASERTYEVPQGLDPHELAMILFTSGTTGRSKGVMLSHGNLVDNTFDSEEPGDPASELYLNVLPIHHVFCLTCDVLTTLRYGSTLALNRDLKQLVRHIQLFQPTAIRMVPMMARALLSRATILAKQREDEGAALQDVVPEVFGARLNRIVCGGGYLAEDLARRFLEIGIKVQQGYGMSECSPKISVPDWSRTDKLASVGRLVDRCEARVVDGELQVRSPSVMLGYYGEPDKTAEALTEDGWLRTGDLGHVDDEGFVYLTGRVKNLIILSNGENVAPEELENLFVDDRLVQDVLVFEDNDMICCEIYPDFKLAEVSHIDDIDGAIQQIVSGHNASLPTFKRIMRVRVRRNPFKKTSSRKIIRDQYFADRDSEAEEAARRSKPENEAQEAIAKLVAQALGHERFGMDTDLYEAGLDSFGSTVLMSSIADEMGANITFSELMDNATVRKIEALVASKAGSEQADYSLRQVYPLTSTQLYFAYVLRGNTTANLPFLFKLHPSVDLERLQACVRELFEVHPVMKDIVQPDEDGVMRNFRDDTRDVEVPIYSVGTWEWGQIRPNLVRPFMYQPGERLYHVAIYVTPEGAFLFFDLAHIIGDGISMDILFEDLNRLYAGERLEHPSYTFYEYILDDKAREDRGESAQDIAYFGRLMGDFKIRKSILTRPDDHDLEHAHNAELRDRFLTLSPQEIQGFGQQYGVSENTIFLTAFNYTIGIFSNEKDTISSSIHGGRTDSRWEHMVGQLFKTYFFRYTNKPHETVPELLKREGRQIMESMRCRLSCLHPDEMFFQFQGKILEVDEIGGKPAQRQSIVLDSLPFHLNVMRDSEGYYYILRYWENRFDKYSLELFMSVLETIVGAMLRETSVRRLAKHLPEGFFPKHYSVTAAQLEQAASVARPGAEGPLLSGVGADEQVKAYVFNDTLRKQPYGAWGDLYVLDHDPRGCEGSIDNPYGEGTLYKTGITARIMPEGQLDVLQNNGRTVMCERTMGRVFPDLGELEREIEGRFAGVEKAEAYCTYDTGLRSIPLCIDLTGRDLPSAEEVNDVVRELCGEVMLPARVRLLGD